MMKFLLSSIVVVLYVGLPEVTHAQVPGIPLDCPVGWKKNFRTNMCYWFNNNEYVTQYKAGQKCANRGGHLVTINDPDENKFIKDNYEINPNNTAQSEYAWIGLYEVWEDKWAWEQDHSDATFFVWAQDQPDNYRGGEDFGTIRAKTGEWYDMRSNQDYGYICEKEIVPDTTPKPPSTPRPPTFPPLPTTQAPPPPTTQAPPPPSAGL